MERQVQPSVMEQRELLFLHRLILIVAIIPLTWNIHIMEQLLQDGETLALAVIHTVATCNILQQ